MSEQTTDVVPDDGCICDGLVCLGVPGESDDCAACRDQDPEEACLREVEDGVFGDPWIHAALTDGSPDSHGWLGSDR